MIPTTQISTEHIRAAIDRIDSEGVPPHRASASFEVVFNSKRYPPKYVVSLAAKLATGKELLPNEFSGGEETNSFLRERGFEVVPKERQTIQQNLEHILDRYAAARGSEPIGKEHQLWGTFEELQEELAELETVKSRATLKVSWSAGQGVWAKVPWIAFLDSKETTTTQKGVYCVILFRQDTSGLYLTLNQGVTEPRERLGAREGRKFLRDRAATIRERVRQIANAGFQLDDAIDLRADPGLGAEYATSTIAYKLYERGKVPEDATIAADLSAMLSAYDEYLTMTVTTSNVWIFQASPKYYDIRGAIRKLKEQTWLVSAYKNRIRAGDRAYLWESGDDAGILATAHVVADPTEISIREQEQPFVRNAEKFDGLQTRAVLRIDHVLARPLLRKNLLTDPILGKMQVIAQPRGTNFVVTAEQAERIEQLLSESKESTEVSETNKRIAVPKNLILYGPPGTGKTYQTINKALDVLDPEYHAENKDDRKKLKERFDELVRSGRVEFVTFHQSFAYEDFVEGIRAETTPDGQIRYDVKDGVFKDLCDKARRASGFGGELGINASPRIWKISIDGTGPSTTRDYCLGNGEARIGWGDVGDLRALDEANEEFKKLGSNDKSTLRAFCEEIRSGDILLCIKSATEVQAVGVVQADYEFDLAVPAPVKPDYRNVRRANWFLNGLSLSLGPLNSGKGFTQKTIYELDRFNWNQLLELIRSRIDVPPPLNQSKERPNFVLIIDEINRGNISRIFGELITLIETSKREGAAEALKTTLPYSKEHFGVPPNVYLVGTMNTADRSLTGLDIALRRRFRFQEVPPQPDLLQGVVIEGVDVRALLMILNERVEVLLDRDHCLGHCYFLPLRNDNSLARLALIFDQEIIPLLREYFFEDSERIRWVLNDHRKEAAYQFLLKPKSDLTKLFGDEPGMPTETRRLQLNTTAFLHIQSFSGIIEAP
jgi:5-methylcytosine-specific restriction protein B